MNQPPRTNAADKSGSARPGPDSYSPGGAVPAAETDYSPDAVLKRVRNHASGEGNPQVRIPGWLALAVVAAVGYAIYYGYNRLGVPDIPLCVVNTSSEAPLEIRLNGKKAGQASRMIGEDPAAALMAVLKEGENQLEARDGSGAVVASETVVVTKDSNGYLWTPLPDPSFAFQIQTSEYTESGGSEYWSPLEGSGPLRPLPEWVTYWFRDTPKMVSVPKGWKATHERALRRTAQ